MATGLYVGRFQPFHLGHVQAVKYILDRVDDVVIVVGSAQHSHTVNNPFTAGERVTMIRLGLKEASVDASRYIVTPLPDAEFHKVWAAHLLSQTPEFQVAFTNEPLTGRLLREESVRVEKIPFYHRDLYTATEVRARMLNGGNWKELLPNSVAKYLENIGGEERVREISLSDKA